MLFVYFQLCPKRNATPTENNTTLGKFSLSMNATATNLVADDNDIDIVTGTTTTTTIYAILTNIHQASVLILSKAAQDIHEKQKNT